MKRFRTSLYTPSASNRTKMTRGANYIKRARAVLGILLGIMLFIEALID